MSFQFCDRMIHDYWQQGYVIFREIVPVSLLSDLRREAIKARPLAREIGGPSIQRLFPLSAQADRLDLQPFIDYCELAPIQNAIDRLLGPNFNFVQMNGLSLFTEPESRPWNCGWHRDFFSELPTNAEDDATRAYVAEMQSCLFEAFHDPLYFNQVNCAIYADSCTWYVPGSHLRYQDLPGEREGVYDTHWRDAAAQMSEVEAERFWFDYCRSFPGAVQVQLQPGDFMLYRQVGWHLGNYNNYLPRATLHSALVFQGERDWENRYFKTRREAKQRMAERQKAAAATA